MRGAWIALVALAGLLSTTDAPAQTRDSADCMLAWHRAVSSYLTQNRTGFPQDEKMSVFEPACQKEQEGDKAGARVEAIMIGAINLAKLDKNGCRSFMKSYAGSKSAGEVCSQAESGPSDTLRKLIKESIPPKH